MAAYDMISWGELAQHLSPNIVLLDFMPRRVFIRAFELQLVLLTVASCFCPPVPFPFPFRTVAQTIEPCTVAVVCLSYA